MAVPKGKISKRRGNSRFAHWKLAPLSLVECDHCHAMITPHTACPACGYYKGKPAIAVEEEKDQEKKKK